MKDKNGSSSVADISSAKSMNFFPLLNPDISSLENSVDPDQMASYEAI